MGRSTTKAGVELIQQIFDAWEDSLDAIDVFCDLSKAFDCFHLGTVIRKLNHYGVTGRSLGLLEFYLIEPVGRQAGAALLNNVTAEYSVVKYRQTSASCRLYDIFVSSNLRTACRPTY
ncbi:hypothetical protein EVAR_67161_1 [Eumeta japonica]|uniref:Reverse transcriptase domain-containing protein n=1 Tax=Eumeta variegata TaxID=151549 RepID=A0A4C1ZLT1_EUMVA|nr:hypothetical protein EVAR_67161_1 [Eumeta japonica]